MSSWLGSLQLSCYAECFSRAGYSSLDSVQSITADDLTCIGVVSPRHQQILVNAIRHLCTSHFVWTTCLLSAHEPEVMCSYADPRAQDLGCGRATHRRQALDKPTRWDFIRWHWWRSYRIHPRDDNYKNRLGAEPRDHVPDTRGGATVLKVGGGTILLAPLAHFWPVGGTKYCLDS